MASRDFTVQVADWDRDREALRHVRTVVFVDEQQVPVEEEWDALDPECEHVLARDADGTPIGTGRLTPEHKIGRMAVLKAWRGRGVGTVMLKRLIERARTLGWPEVHLHAQVSALGFYQAHGFSVCGDTFVEAGITHKPMRLALNAPSESDTPQALSTRSREEVRDVYAQLITQARRSICVHSEALEPGILDSDAALTAVRRLATGGRNHRVRVLLADTERPTRDDHRLLALAQRLPSAIELRVLCEDADRAYPSAFLLNDAGGYLVRPLATRFDGRGSTLGASEHARLQRYFEQVWERAQPATAWRALDI
ncbi:GNAT family N-acetyltransferase [Oleiagrimonas sp. C23AA]|uniref:GNAT family N-acetyltransferase n=1 Tax=Oleiagrimonas sp. C23AA TaxID=2719047 RepID=UPI0014224454|nr:GNAT family N-acetyltransferase [Oleiagrimonas sp. C23AA]NII10520.1 GNAT family N-acetyltransferase [Oleiagrimonas sp. C23AA]